MTIRASARRAWRSIRRLAAIAPLVLRDSRSKYPEVVLRFEREFARYHGCEYGVSFCNGTSSLEAALFAVNVRPGDRVLVPALTFHASISPVLNVGAEPIYVDADPETSNIAIADFARKALRGVRAAIVTHLWGNPIDMDRVAEIARDHGIVLIEDCSHAHGASWRGQRVGGFGSVGCFSLQGGKPVSSGGEGGIAVTNDPVIRDRLLLSGHFGRSENGSDLDYQRAYGAAGCGHKMRAHPHGIALAAVDFRTLGRENARKRSILQALTAKLASVPTVKVLTPPAGAEPGGCFGGLPVRLERPVAAEVSTRLLGLGIRSSSTGYAAWHRDPFMLDLAYRQAVMQSRTRSELPGAIETSGPDPCPGATDLLDRLLLIEPDDHLLGRRGDRLIEVLRRTVQA